MFVGSFAAESEAGEGGQGSEQADGAFCENFRGGHAEHGGELDDGVGARKDRVAGAGVFVEHGHFAALGEIAAHDADGGVAAAVFFRLIEQVGVPVMKGIVFANDTANFHFIL